MEGKQTEFSIDPIYKWRNDKGNFRSPIARISIVSLDPSGHLGGCLVSYPITTSLLQQVIKNSASGSVENNLSEKFFGIRTID